LAENSAATIQIFDMSGKLVKSIPVARYNAGLNTVEFNVSQLGQGTYFTTVESNDSRKVAKFVVM
ncbi:MAG: T9SS type A sorting domain-containing protein, partial [Flavobacteriales bacterium]|nr:T9SS type A sorting domain-containing protein [Flavobacteriales bacterium]